MRRSPLDTIVLVLGSVLWGAALVLVGGGAYVFYLLSQPDGEGLDELGWPFDIIFQMPSTIDNDGYDSPEDRRYLGNTGSYSSGFDSDTETMLAAGPGTLIGSASAVGKPVQGLKVRLALNDGVYSQWAETDGNGRYVISLPYGDYRVEGYQLDYENANKVLAGLINHDTSCSSGDSTITVREGQPGRGVDLSFVLPVVKITRDPAIAHGQPAELAWEAYPGAHSYRLQVTERRSPRAYASSRQLFKWDEQPVVTEPRAELSSLGVELRKGRSYYVDVHALGATGTRISRTPWDPGRTPDFIVAED